MQEVVVTMGYLRAVTLQKKDYSDNKNVARFFDPVVVVNNTEKVLEKITCGDG